MKKTGKHIDPRGPAPPDPGRISRWASDPLNAIALSFFLLWGVVGIWFRPIGDFGVETDFYGDFVPQAAQWMSGNPSIMHGYRGPFYYLLIGVLSTLGDTFLLAKLLSAACAGIGIRLIGGLLRKLWNPTVAVAGTLFLIANPTLIQYAYRACTDFVFWALFMGAMFLFFADSRRYLLTWAMAGACAGLAYLTRYNGVALVPGGILAAFILVRPWKRAAVAVLAFLGTWLVIALPWIFYLWNQTGDPFWNRNFALVAEEVYCHDPNLANIGRLVDSVGFESLGEVFKLDPGRFIGTMGGNIFRHLWLDINHLVGPGWAIFGLVGFALSFRSWGDRRRIIFALAGMITHLSLLPVFYNQRFMLPLLIWWAAGAGNAAHYLTAWISGRISGYSTTPPKVLNQRALRIGMFVAMALLAFQTSFMGFRQSQGEAGGPAMPLVLLDLADSVRDSELSLGPGTPIAARKPHIGYYLEVPTGPISTGGRWNDLSASGIHYLLVSDFEARMYPHLAPMLVGHQPAQKFPGYRFIAAAQHRERTGRVQTATLYALDNPDSLHFTELPAQAIQPPRAYSPPGLDRMDFLRSNLARWTMNFSVEQPLLRFFDRMKPESRTHPLVTMTEGDAYLALKKYDRAQRIYLDILHKEDDSLETLLRLALVSHLAGNPEGFEQYLNEFTALWRPGEDPSLEDWYNEAATHARAKSYLPAAALLIKIRLMDPDSQYGEDYRMLGYCYLNFRHIDHARSAFAKYLELVPNDPEILGVLEDDSRFASP